MVAIDDLGAGNSGLRLWSELRPDFVKLDIYFAANIDSDGTKRQFVASLCDLAGKLGCKMILEGVERKEEYQVARQIGIQYCQGYLFGKPADHTRAIPGRAVGRR
jgi:FOG: EAL domain